MLHDFIEKNVDYRGSPVIEKEIGICMTMTELNSKKDNFISIWRYSSVGLEMGLCVVIGITGGYYLDRHFHTSPYLTIIFLLFGMAAAVKVIFRVIKEVQKDDERNNDR